MAHWAQIDENSIVIQITVGDNNDPAGDEGYSWLIENLGGTWIKTSFNTYGGIHNESGTPLRKNYAGIGYTFDGVGFAAPQPYPSWILNSQSYLWEAPTPMPTDGQKYIWVEDDLNWQLVPTE